MGFVPCLWLNCGLNWGGFVAGGKGFIRDEFGYEK